MSQRFMLRQFRQVNMEEFQYLLNKVTWQEVFLEPEEMLDLIHLWIHSIRFSTFFFP